MAAALTDSEVQRLAYERWKTEQHDPREWTLAERETALADAIYGIEGACRCPLCVYRRVAALSTGASV